MGRHTGRLAIWLRTCSMAAATPLPPPTVPLAARAELGTELGASSTWLPAAARSPSSAAAPCGAAAGVCSGSSSFAGALSCCPPPAAPRSARAYARGQP